MKFFSYWSCLAFWNNSLREITRGCMYKIFIFIPQFRWSVSLTTVERPQRINNSSSTMVKPGRRGLAVLRSMVRARNVTHAFALPYRRDATRTLYSEEIGTPTRTCADSRQVVSHRWYPRQVWVSVPNFRFVRPFLVAFHHDPFNSSCSPTDVDHDRII